MKILITPGAGMVGRHAAEFYALKGEEVIAFDNLMRSKLFGYDKKSVEYNWNYPAKYKNVKRIPGDIKAASRYQYTRRHQESLGLGQTKY